MLYNKSLLTFYIKVNLLPVLVDIDGGEKVGGEAGGGEKRSSVERRLQTDELVVVGVRLGASEQVADGADYVWTAGVAEQVHDENIDGGGDRAPLGHHRVQEHVGHDGPAQAHAADCQCSEQPENDLIRHTGYHQ